MITFTNLGKQGRLGNSWMQAAATISLAMDNDDDYIFPPWEYQNYFNLKYSNSIHPTLTYNEPHYHYNKIPHTQTKDMILNLSGYWQSYKYWENNKDIIQNLLTPNIGYGIKYNHTAVHCRRGDYLNLTREYEQLNLNYYKQAMDIIKSKYYIIFSDDIAWCKQNFIGDNFIFSEGKSAIEDFSLQLACEHNIIANSSFSYCAAYLNKNPSKIVIAPNRWFGPALPHDTKDLLPPQWIKI